MSQKIIKNQKFKILKTKWSGDIVDRYLSPKFGINSFIGIRDVFGQQTMTDDAGHRMTTAALLYIIIKVKTNT